MNSLKKLAALSFQEWLLLFQALLILPPVTLSLKLIGLKKTQALLTRFSPKPTSNPLTILQAPTEARMVNAIAFRLGIACLGRSVALWWILRLRGIDSQVCLGVNKEQDEFHAHAWVEHEGNVLNDRPDVRERYNAFPSVSP